MRFVWNGPYSLVTARGILISPHSSSPCWSDRHLFLRDCAVLDSPGIACGPIIDRAEKVKALRDRSLRRLAAVAVGPVGCFVTARRPSFYSELASLLHSPSEKTALPADKNHNARE
jgi:hypothetical protein